MRNFSSNVATSIIKCGILFWTAQTVTAANAPSKKNLIPITIIGDIWCPYICESSNARPGFFSELVSAALKDSVFKPSYQTAPWTKAVVQTKEGKADILLSAPDDEKGDFIDVGYYTLQSPTCGFAAQDSQKTIVTGSDLDQFSSIGIIKDYAYGAEIEKFTKRKDLPPGKLQELLTEESAAKNLQKVSLKRIEVALEDPAVVAYWVDELKIPALKNIGCSVDTVNISLGLSKKVKHYKELSTAITKGLKAIEKSGEAAALLKKYHITPVTHAKTK